MRYNAFISYRHSEFDSFVAENIHKKLENFKLPAYVRKKTGLKKNCIERVFRDTEELALADNLSDELYEALDESDYLIAICTPRYAESQWCMKEIAYFLKKHDKDHVLLVLAEGEPDDSFPKSLRYEETVTVDEKGNTIIHRIETEPLAADARGENKRKVLQAINTVVVKLCAQMFDLNYDDLRQRKRKQKIRRLATIFGSITAAITVVAIMSIIMLVKISTQKETISEQYDEIQARSAGSMAAVSDQLIRIGRRKDAIYALRSVLKDESDINTCNSSAVKALYRALGVYEISDYCMPKCVYEMDGVPFMSTVSFDGKYVCACDSVSLKVFDAENGNIVKNVECYKFVMGMPNWAVFAGSEAVIYYDGEKMIYDSFAEGETFEITGINPRYTVLQDPDGNVTVISTDKGLAGIGSNGEVLYETDLYKYMDEEYLFQDMICSEGNIAVSYGNFYDYMIFVVDALNGNVIYTSSGKGSSNIVKGLYSGVLYTVKSGYNDKMQKVELNIKATDYRTGTTVWNRTMYDLAIYNIAVIGERVFIYNNNTIVGMNVSDGEKRNTYYLEKDIVDSFIDNGVLKSINRDGEIYYTDEYLCYDYTDLSFLITPASKLSKAMHANGDMFYQFEQANYIVRYSKENDTTLTATEYTESFDMYATNLAYEAFDKMNINPRLLSESFYSDDGKLVFALYSNNVAKLYNASDMVELNSFDADEIMYVDIKYLECAGCYVLSSPYRSYFLNDSYEIVCETDRVVDEKDGKMIMLSRLGQFYIASYVDYPELIKRADIYLDGHITREEIKQKYNIK